jgi:apolipoprotein N-acyltransferase
MAREPEDLEVDDQVEWEDEEWDELEQEQTFTLPLLGALYSSLVIVTVVAILNSHIGRSLEQDIDAPARTLIAAPVILTALVVFVASMLALLVPEYRRPFLRVAEIGGWLIPAWLVIGGMVLGAISFALHYGD